MNLNRKIYKNYEKILKKGKKQLPYGHSYSGPNINTLEEKIAEGYNFIAFSVDIRMLSNIAKKPFEKIEFLKNEYRNNTC